MNILRKNIQKILPLSSRFSTVSQFAGFTQRIFQKISVTRLPNQQFTIYLDTNDKISTLFKHLQNMYPGKEFIATNKFEQRAGKPITEEDLKLSEEMKEMEVVDLLMHSNLMVYERGELEGKNTPMHNLCIGIQLKEFHETNNRNVCIFHNYKLPQHISTNILSLAQQWRTDRSVQYALSKVQPYNQAQHNQYLTNLKQLQSQAQQSYRNYIALSKFYKNQFFQNGKAKSLMANLIALMGVNWVFLFGVTYGAYGWDVGEPLSYLTVLAVELIAMLGIFSMNEMIEKTGKEDWKNIAIRMNLKSLLRTREYLIAYTKRQF